MRALKFAVLSLAVLALTSAVVSAQEKPTTDVVEALKASGVQQPTVDDVARVSAAASGGGSDSRGVGAGLVILGAGLGIGILTASAVAAMARQPEMAGNVQTAMIISAALIEGVAFFALIVIGFILRTY